MKSSKFTHKQMKSRFEKIAKHVVQKNSPSEAEGNPMAVEDEADAEDQEGKKTKYRSVDLTNKTFK